MIDLRAVEESYRHENLISVIFICFRLIEADALIYFNAHWCFSKTIINGRTFLFFK